SRVHHLVGHYRRESIGPLGWFDDRIGRAEARIQPPARIDCPMERLAGGCRMSPRKVLFVVRTWTMGGGHTIIRLLLDHLPRDQFDVRTVVFDAPGDGDANFAEH